MNGLLHDSARAALSKGTSHPAVHALVARLVRQEGIQRGTLVDLGCGTGTLATTLSGLFERYIGCDLVSYAEFPQAQWASFVQADLNRPPLPLADAGADVVVSLETIEHLENPRSFMRELARIVRPGGFVVVTTPNQLSLLSKASLLLKNQFNAFQEGPGLYPAHVTALLEVDLLRIARECGFRRAAITYTNCGRIPLTPWHWPAPLGFRGRPFSDNVLLLASRDQKNTSSIEGKPRQPMVTTRRVAHGIEYS